MGLPLGIEFLDTLILTLATNFRQKIYLLAIKFTAIFHFFGVPKISLIFQISKIVWNTDMYALMLTAPLFPQEHYDVDSW
ncbi:MAG: hypothetical protein CMM59_06440 [Rhodospirillaceae bacterium]|nr:hypothetical protein [Rhodospirillaceae bacterium]|tara:strand:- start:149 stop:388 length:240 start_codon:yes stop_codon:yes gene_type:complete